jgi:hypothetical protein
MTFLTIRVWRGFKYREVAWNSVFEENHIRRLEIGNRARPASKLKWNDHKVALDVNRRFDGLLRSLLSQRHPNQEYACGNRSADLSYHGENAVA